MTYLTKAEVANLLRVSIRTVTAYTSSGLLPLPSRLGRRLLWDEARLLQAINAEKSHGEIRGFHQTHPSRGRPRKYAG